MKWCKLKSQKLSSHKTKNRKSIVSFFFIIPIIQKLCIKPSKDIQDDTAWKQSSETPPYMCY